MMRLIPPKIPSSSPPGEKKLFTKFSIDRRFNDWIAIHSLDIVEHLSNVAGELDFIIINPKSGILCVEVKSHKRIICKNNEWYYGDNIKPGKNPFKQIKDSSFSLRNYVIGKYHEFEKIPWWHIVIFPNCKFIYDSPSWEPWMVIDRDGCKNLYNSLSVSFNKSVDHISSKSKIKNSLVFSEGDLTRLLNILRPEFETDKLTETIGAKRKRELKKFTEEQYEALDNMQENNRIFFKGSAGTGKTFLALEAAKRTAKSGKKVLLLCYNKALSEWIKDEINNFKKIDIYNIDSLLLKLCDNPDLLDQPNRNDEYFWNFTLTNAALSSKKMEALSGSYDQIIIDEAQDLLKAPYLDLIDQLLIGGLKSGKWIIFGDFSNQSIFSSNISNKFFITLNQFEKYLGGNYAKYLLTKNCRNIKQIGDFYESFVQLEPGYNSYLRSNLYGAKGAELISVSSNSQRVSITIQLVKKILNEDENKKIAILSIYKDDFLDKVKDKLDDHNLNFCNDIRLFQQGSIFIGTVQSFKGLEADSVILRKGQKMNTPEDLNLFYVGCSRARDDLYVF